MSVEKKKVRVSVHFDETEITEYDKERGHRMKIEEPKTPYHHQDMSDDEEERAPKVNMNELMEGMQKMAKKQEFESRRKDHYNEAQAMKAALSRKYDDEDDEDDE